jgi:hypothetical protein
VENLGRAVAITGVRAVLSENRVESRGESRGVNRGESGSEHRVRIGVKIVVRKWCEVW